MEYKLDVELSPRLAPYRSTIEATIKPYLKIQLTDNANPTWWQSKFGGLPYLPKDFEYPTGISGENLYLLAQINFAEVPPLVGLPSKGILQFYLANNNMYGCDLKDPTKQDKFRVVYFSEVILNEQEIVTDYRFLSQLQKQNLPFEGCSRIKFIFAQEPISIRDYQFAIFGSDDVSNDLYDEYWNNFNPTGHKLLGYPYFSQEDPRGYFLEAQQNDQESYILFFQIDSDQHKEINIMWGDMGVANFFIKRADLDELNFSNILYNWDCT